MVAPAFTSGLARDAVRGSIANLTCLLRAPRYDAAAAALMLPLAATVLIFQGCLSEVLIRSAVKQ